MNALGNMVTYTVVLEKDEAGWIVATVPELPGCYTQGKTPVEALARIKEAIEVYLADETDLPGKRTFIGVHHIPVA